MHHYRDTWQTYWQQYVKLADLVADSWTTHKQHASPALTEYLGQIKK